MNLRTVMHPLKAKGNWNIAKGKLKQMLARIIEDDLHFVDGKVDELVGRIQKRAAMSRSRVENSREVINSDGGSQA